MSIANEDIDTNIVSKSVPYNEAAEQLILGSIMNNNELYNKISDILLVEHFYVPLHKKIFEVIVYSLERGTIATPITLKHYFSSDDDDFSDYLERLVELGSTIINIVEYAKLVIDFALRRRLIGVGENIVNEGYNKKMDITAEDQLEHAEQQLFELADYSTGSRGDFLHLRDNLLVSLDKIQSAFKNKEHVTGISSGFIDLDSLLGGFQDSDLLILAGRPSMGKTAIVINIAYSAAKFLEKKYADSKEKHAIGVFSLEMSGDQLATRLISMISGISSSKLRSGKINQDDFAKVVSANKELYNIPFFIDDTPSLSISALRTRARRLKRKHNLSLLVIDYLQLVKGSAKSSEANRVQEISEITQGLKAIAKELNIPVIALSQLSRAVEQREDKRPLLSDLRESGSIEQDADIVMFIYREDYYLLRRQPKEGTIEHEKWQMEMDKVMNVTELIVAKQRNGPIGNVKIYFDSATTRFTNFVDQNSL